MCSVEEYKNRQAAGKTCPHSTSESVFMFGGFGLMESPVRNFPTCTTDGPGMYKHDANTGGQTGQRDVTEGHIRMVNGDWVDVLDWELYEPLCDLWQADSANRWSLIGACRSGLRSPVNPGVLDSLLVNPVQTKPLFPDKLTNSPGIYKASSWQDRTGTMWLFGGYSGEAVDDTSPGKELDGDCSVGGTVCSTSLWYYDTSQAGSWSWQPATPPKIKQHRVAAAVAAATIARNRKELALLHGADNLSSFSRPELGRCGAATWQPWYQPNFYRDSRDTQVCASVNPWRHASTGGCSLSSSLLDLFLIPPLPRHCLISDYWS
jgi:hypothetical protein